MSKSYEIYPRVTETDPETHCTNCAGIFTTGDKITVALSGQVFCRPEDGAEPCFSRFVTATGKLVAGHIGVYVGRAQDLPVENLLDELLPPKPIFDRLKEIARRSQAIKK